MRTTVFCTPLLTPLLRLLSSALLGLLGWRTRGMELPQQRFVLIAAPHTSNWDFPLMLLVVLKLRLRVYWMGKHTLFPRGLGWFMRWLGGIPVDRSAAHNVVEQTVRQYQEHDELVILNTPEGTRKKVERWKTGFYHIAHLAQVPILLGYLDTKSKEAGLADSFTPTGDLDRDMAEIRTFYAGKRGINPENA